VGGIYTYICPKGHIGFGELGIGECVGGANAVYCFCHQFIVQFVFFASRLPFSAVCLPGNLVHWTFVCLLEGGVSNRFFFAVLSIWFCLTLT